MESALRPRDIQARIRAGESPETVAAAAQTSVESIMAFATPVLAERAHIAQTAMAASVRRRATEAAHAARTLGDAARVLIGDLGLHEDDVAWDSWRRPDGQWTLVADYVAGGRDRHAEFTYDVRGRYVVADNDEARLLTGEAKAVPFSGDATAADPSTPAPPHGRPRLAAVQDELPLGDDALELVREPPRAVPDPETPRAAEETEETEPEDAEPEETGAEDTTEIVPQLVAEIPEADPDATARWLDEPTPAETATDAAPTEEPAGDTGVQDDDEDEDRGESEESSAAPAAPRRKGRASVPSWDEIMFGGGKSE